MHVSTFVCSNSCLRSVPGESSTTMKYTQVPIFAGNDRRDASPILKMRVYLLENTRVLTVSRGDDPVPLAF